MPPIPPFLLLGQFLHRFQTVNKALDALRENPDTKYLAKMGLDKLLQNLDKIPQPLDAAIRNGGKINVRKVVRERRKT
jgi:hypothetical protein